MTCLTPQTVVIGRDEDFTINCTGTMFPRPDRVYWSWLQRFQVNVSTNDTNSTAFTRETSNETSEAYLETYLETESKVELLSAEPEYWNMTENAFDRVSIFDICHSK